MKARKSPLERIQTCPVCGNQVYFVAYRSILRVEYWHQLGCGEWRGVGINPKSLDTFCRALLVCGQCAYPMGDPSSVSPCLPS